MKWWGGFNVGGHLKKHCCFASYFDDNRFCVEWQDGCITATNLTDQAWYFRALSRLGTRNHSVMIVL